MQLSDSDRSAICFDALLQFLAQAECVTLDKKKLLALIKESILSTHPTEDNVKTMLQAAYKFVEESTP